MRPRTSADAGVAGDPGWVGGGRRVGGTGARSMGVFGGVPGAPGADGEGLWGEMKIEEGGKAW